MDNSTIDIDNLREIIKEFKKEGFTKIDNAISKDKIDLCKETIFSLFKKISKENFREFKDAKFDQKTFNEAIISLRKSDKKTFGKIYDSLQSSLSLKAISTDNLLINIASKLLNTKTSNLMVRSTVIRLDVPQDKRNIFDWHYDTYSPNDPKHIPSGGITMVVPFTNFTIENGCPEICLGSHKKAPQQKIKYSEGNNSEVYSISEEYLNNFDKVRIIASPGDLIIFPMTAVHRSGFNISKEVRVCSLIRYYSYDDESFVPLRENFEPIV